MSEPVCTGRKSTRCLFNLLRRVKGGARWCKRELQASMCVEGPLLVFAQELRWP